MNRMNHGDSVVVNRNQAAGFYKVRCPPVDTVIAQKHGDNGLLGHIRSPPSSSVLFYRAAALTVREGSEFPADNNHLGRVQRFATRPVKSLRHVSCEKKNSPNQLLQYFKY